MLEDYIAVDLELTGLNPKTDRILEIGAVQVIGKQVCGTFSKLVCPGRRLDKRITALTGITDEMAEQGEAQDDAVNAFLEFAGDLVWVGHHIGFDYKFIRQWEVNHRIQRTCYAADTLKIARKCLSSLEHKTLDCLCRYYGIAREKSHRALADAEAAQSLYEMLEQDFCEKEPGLFTGTKLQYKVRRQTPATPRQKEYLKRFLEYHGLSADILDVPLAQMSRSDASRITDRLIGRYGKL